jgi:uncharacterized glyoxalase superfamily protein PhnB
MPASLIVNIDVPSLDAGIAFYTRAFEFRLCRFLFDKSVAELESALGRLFLIEQPQGSLAVPGTSIVRTYQTHWTPVHLDLPVSHLENAMQRCLAAGATSRTAVTVNSFGRLIAMRDPFGHGFCLIEFNAEGYDAATSE